MGLRTKFNLALLAAFAVGLGLTALIADRFIQSDVRSEVLQNARIMMQSALAIRTYTSQQIQPLLADKMDEVFLPHSVPSFAAQTNFDLLRRDFPEFTYKEAALNPTNLDDRATDWEADIIQTFRDSPDRRELIADRDTPTGPVLVLAQPLRVGDPNCLQCHSTPDAAPPSMIALYGSNNGFGWKLGDTIGAQIVSVPLSLPSDRAHHIFLIVLGALTVIFAAVMVLLNLLLQVVVVRPVVQIANMASEVSMGNMELPEYEHKGKDEIASLSKSFNRMRRSLENALRMLAE